MGKVCLILPVASVAGLSADWVARCRRALGDAGHSVEVLAVFDPNEPHPVNPANGEWRWQPASRDGLSLAVMTGLRQFASGRPGDYLIVLDPAQGYHPDDLDRLIEPLAQGRAELTVARRIEVAAESSGIRSGGRKLAAGGIGRVAHSLLGVSDMFSGLVAMTPDVAASVADSFNPIGGRFTIDLLFRTKGRRVEVPVRIEAPRLPNSLRIDDFRHLKRLADDRYGNASRLIQFCAVGASGMVVDLTFYALFQFVFSRTGLAHQKAPLVGGTLDLPAAGALAIALALTWNFSLNRRLTFNYARSGSLVRQYLTYALSNALGIALSFTLRLVLPSHIGFFRRHRLAAAVVGIVTATGISFTMSRWLVFSHHSVARDRKRADARATTQVV